MKTKEIALAIKQHLIDMSNTDRLPSDLTLLDENELIKIIDSVKPSVREIEIKKAMDFLVGDRDSVIKQLEAIENTVDKTTLIDYVDGVDVWEKIEFSFTCDEFLSLIKL